MSVLVVDVRSDVEVDGESQSGHTSDFHSEISYQTVTTNAVSNRPVQFQFQFLFPHTLNVHGRNTLRCPKNRDSAGVRCEKMKKVQTTLRKAVLAPALW